MSIAVAVAVSPRACRYNVAEGMSSIFAEACRVLLTVEHRCCKRAAEWQVATCHVGEGWSRMGRTRRREMAGRLEAGRQVCGLVSGAQHLA